jgi:hypothetical protein
MVFPFGRPPPQYADYVTPTPLVFGNRNLKGFVDPRPRISSFRLFQVLG